MTENSNSNLLVPLHGRGEVLGEHKENKLISRVSYDASELVRTLSSHSETPQYRAGGREFYEEDFRQLQKWAAELGLPGGADDMVAALDSVFERLSYRGSDLWSSTWYEAGRIKSFQLDGNLKLSFPHLPELNRLDCRNNQLTELDLTAVPALTRLNCFMNELTELNLSAVPSLTELTCAWNELTELDLSALPALTELNCDINRLTELDLSAVPALTRLNCFMNELTELNLSAVPALTELTCAWNELTKLDLSAQPALTWLNCRGNQLTELDIRRFHAKEIALALDPAVTVHKRPDQRYRTIEL